MLGYGRFVKTPHDHTVPSLALILWMPALPIVSGQTSVNNPPIVHP